MTLNLFNSSYHALHEIELLMKLETSLKDFMNIINFLKKKILRIKNRFDVQKVPIMLQKDLEAMTYLNKI